MCMPSPQVAAAPAPTIPTIQAATNLQLGPAQSGVPRGAAGLGRLQLRLDGDPATATRPPAATPSPGPTVVPAGAQTAQQGTGASGNFQYAPNTGLRLAPPPPVLP